MVQEEPMALPSSRFTGVSRPTSLAQLTRLSTPRAAAVFTAGRFMEWTSASRRVTSPLKVLPKLEGFQDTPDSSSR